MTSLSRPPPPSSSRVGGGTHTTSIISAFSSPVALSFPFQRSASCFLRACAVRTGSEGSDLLRKPVVQPEKDVSEEDEDSGRKGGYSKAEEEGEWVDWEDQILEDTVPLVGFVRMILHSGKYGCGDRLSPEHERVIVERLLPFHPECEKKIGSGIDYIMVDYHPEYDTSRCMFIVQKDGKVVDFSYWKCIKGLIRKNYPLHADSFILRHFRKRRQQHG